MKNATKNATTGKPDLAARKRYWLADNPGVLARIAEELGVVPSFVSDVLHNRRTSRHGAVESELSKRGAPGFDSEAA